MRILFYVLLLNIGKMCFSQTDDWNLSTSGQITTLDKVGVGTASNLQGVLSINNSDYSQKTLNMTNVNADISFSDHVLTFAPKSSWTQVPYIQWLVPNGNRQAYLGWQKNYFNLSLENGYDFSINGGKVGIGTASPSQLLDVNGIVAVNGQAVLFSDVSDIRIGDITGKDGLRELSIWSGDAERIRINQSGYVGIGTSTPSNKLEVNGTIRSQEVKVEAPPWPDYVFEEGYHLRSLAETEAYVKANKHLPEIPSAEEIETNGLALSEMNMLLLKKIEELTLYVIELKKESETQQEKIEELKEKSFGESY